MFPNRQKQIAFFNKTYDSFSRRLDKNRSSEMQMIFLREMSKYKDFGIVDVSNLRLKDKTNEAFRTALHAYHQENPFVGIIAIRVIEGRHRFSIYHNQSYLGHILSGSIQKVVAPLTLDTRSVKLQEDFQGSVTSSINGKLLENWAIKKGINPVSGSLFDNEWVRGLYIIFEKMENVLSASYPKNDARRKRHELNRLVNSLVSSGYINSKVGDELKKSRERLEKFIGHERLHDFIGALRLISNAANNTVHQYLKSVGFELSRIMIGEVGQLVSNQLNKEKQRDIVASHIETIGAVLDGDNSVAHVPLFYVPSCGSCDNKEGAALLSLVAENNKMITYLPCIDIQLTVECADTVLKSEEMQGNFFKAVAGWAKKL